MSNVYRIHGSRYLRKYTADERSSIYAYMAEVRKIANSLCTVPWERVVRDIAATTTIHTEEGLDWNVTERDRFDAAEWCGDHSDGFHRAFAQAACYVFELPDSAVGTSIEKLGIQVTSDPYNPYGARISAMTSDTLDIPMDCATVREGEVFRAPDEDGLGAAPRLYMRNADGSQTWYANTERVDLEPDTPLVAKKYLFVFCCLENYNRAREGWIEGSSYIDNDIEVTLSAVCADLDASGLNDLSTCNPSERTLQVMRDGVTVDLSGTVSGVVSVTMTSSGVTPDVDESRHVDDLSRIVDESDPGNISATISNVYRRLFVGDTELADFASCNPRRRPSGVGFNVEQARDVTFVNSAGDVAKVRTVTLTASSLLVPFSVPEDMSVHQALFDWSKWLVGRTPAAACKFNVWFRNESVTEIDEKTIRDPAIYNCQTDVVDGWKLVGQAPASAGQVSVALREFSGTVGTFLVTSYVPQSSIEDTSSDFDVGSAPFAYNGVTADSALPVSRLFYKAFDVGHRYTTGETMRHVGAADAVIELQETSLPAGHVWCAGKGAVVGVKSNSKIICSTDGIHFIETSTTFEDELQEIRFVGGKFIALGGFRYYTSSDGRQWTSHVNSFGSSSVSALSIAYGNGRWVIGTGSSIWHSDDFETWAATTVSGSVGTVDFAGNFFVANVDGNVHVSSSGATWNAVAEIEAEYVKIVYNDSGAVLVTGDLNQRLFATTNAGSSWSEIDLDGEDCIDVVYANSSWIAIGNTNIFRCTANQPSAFFKTVEHSGASWIVFNGSYCLLGTSTSVACTDFGNTIIEKSASGFTNYPVPFGSTWISGTKVYDDNSSRKAYVATNNSVGAFSSSNFSEVPSPVKDRLKGYDGLCFPDVSITGTSR